MKYLSVIAILITFITFLPSHNYAQPDAECPKINHLEETSIKDKDELLNALRATSSSDTEMSLTLKEAIETCTKRSTKVE
ncbi:hypothetical protein [Oceanobacillus rekensis]|uniref:hypothetical protein n=1 Tax=Oceanobacillus rekensis TaxID=937927 RepID=UPI001FE4B694|nr:hypothetical protein [Oceanobacillus rekensis]